MNNEEFEYEIDFDEPDFGGLSSTSASNLTSNHTPIKMSTAFHSSTLNSYQTSTERLSTPINVQSNSSNNIAQQTNFCQINQQETVPDYIQVNQSSKKSSFDIKNNMIAVNRPKNPQFAGVQQNCQQLQFDKEEFEIDFDFDDDEFNNVPGTATGLNFIRPNVNQNNYNTQSTNNIILKSQHSMTNSVNLNANSKINLQSKTGPPSQFPDSYRIENFTYRPQTNILFNKNTSENLSFIQNEKSQITNNQTHSSYNPQFQTSPAIQTMSKINTGMTLNTSSPSNNNRNLHHFSPIENKTNQSSQPLITSKNDSKPILNVTDDQRNHISNQHHFPDELYPSMYSQKPNNNNQNINSSCHYNQDLGGRNCSSSGRPVSTLTSSAPYQNQHNQHLTTTVTTDSKTRSSLKSDAVVLKLNPRFNYDISPSYSDTPASCPAPAINNCSFESSNHNQSHKRVSELEKSSQLPPLSFVPNKAYNSNNYNNNNNYNYNNNYNNARHNSIPLTSTSDNPSSLSNRAISSDILKSLPSFKIVPGRAVFELLTPSKFRILYFSPPSQTSKSTVRPPNGPPLTPEYPSDIAPDKYLPADLFSIIMQHLHGQKNSNGEVEVNASNYKDTLFVLRKVLRDGCEAIPDFVLQFFPKFHEKGVCESSDASLVANKSKVRTNRSVRLVPIVQETVGLCQDANVREFVDEELNSIEVLDKGTNVPPPLLRTSLLPFQRIGVSFALMRGGRVLFGDEMGLGKTIQALAVASSFPDDWPLLIVCPTSLRFQWKDQIKRWLGGVLSTKDDRATRKLEEFFAKSPKNKNVVEEDDVIVGVDKDGSKKKFITSINNDLSCGDVETGIEKVTNSTVSKSDIVLETNDLFPSSDSEDNEEFKIEDKGMNVFENISKNEIKENKQEHKNQFDNVLTQCTQQPKSNDLWSTLSDTPVSIHILTDGKTALNELENMKLRKGSRAAIILSYDLLTRICKEQSLVNIPFGVVIIDESHYIKNPSSQRCKAIQPFTIKAKRAILLSGTPALNRPSELHPQLDALLPSLCTATEFSKRFCLERSRSLHIKGVQQAQQKKEYVGVRLSKELHALLTYSVMIRRLKNDVQKQMPDKVRRRIHIEPTARELKEFKAVSDRASRNNLNGAKVETLFNGSFSNDNSILSELYAITGRAKVRGVSEHVKYLMESNEEQSAENGIPFKMLIFCHHALVMDELESVLYRQASSYFKCSAGSSCFTKNKDTCKTCSRYYMRVDGQTSQNTREMNVKRFQADANCRVGLLSITACGTGLNLTAAGMVVFAELHWVPGNLLQAEDRAHRIDSNRSTVEIHYMVAHGTLDDVMWRKVNTKMAVVSSTLDGKQVEMNVQ